MERDREASSRIHQAAVEALAREARQASPAKDAPGISEAVARLRAGEPLEDGSTEARYAEGLALVGLGEVDAGVERITDALEAPRVKARRRKAAKAARASEARAGGRREVPALRRSGDAGGAPGPRPGATKRRTTAKPEPEAPKRAARKTATTKTPARKKPAAKAAPRKKAAGKAAGRTAKKKKTAAGKRPATKAAPRKKTAKKKTASKKTTRSKTTRSKTTRKPAARKKTARKSAGKHTGNTDRKGRRS